MKERIKSFLISLFTTIELKDILLILGTIHVFYGLYLMFPPVAYIALGGFLMHIGWPEGGKRS